MQVKIDCAYVAGSELAERYLLGRLEPREQEAYELHYFDCADCFRDLQLLQSIRAAAGPRPHVDEARGTPTARLTWWGWVLGSAIAASVIAVVMLRQSAAPGPAAVTQRPVVSEAVGPATAVDSADRSASQLAPDEPTPAPTRSSTSRAQVLARLARLDPPRYTARVLRGAADDATQIFQRAMKSYVDGDYAAAAPGLQAAAELDPGRPDIAFYLGVTKLLSGDARGAAAQFERTIALGDSPFLEPAHYCLAKAHVAGGRIDDAQAVATAATQLPGGASAETLQMIEQFESLARP